MVLSEQKNILNRVISKNIKKIFSIGVVIIFILIVVYALFFLQPDKEDIFLSGSIYLNGQRIDDIALVKVLLDGGEIVNQIQTDDNGDFTVDVSDYINEKISFIVIFENHTYFVYDEGGNDLRIVMLSYYLSIYMHKMKQND